MKYRGYFHTVHVLRRRFRTLLGNYFYAVARLKGVSFGSRPVIAGRPHFRVYPGSTIQIGRKAEFLSGSRDNLIGINRPCMLSTLDENSKIIIGDNCGLSGTVIGAHIEIRLGSHVKCGANTLITDGDWHPEDPRSGKPQPVIIEDNVWLGVNSVILKGVTIGRDTVIGANSVVTKNIPAGVIAAGNPCKVIRELQ